MKQKIRIPIFNREFLFNIRNEVEIKDDCPELKWIDSEWAPEINSIKIGELYDSFAEREILRIIKFKTCAYCRSTMYELTPLGGIGIVLVCKNCFYWGGRGTRPFGPSFSRGNLGRLDFITNPIEANIALLINHLNNNLESLYNLTPLQAEKILPNVLKDYLNCEVKAIGGVKDGGIDALAIRGDGIRMIIQIKWREHKIRSESISVVREVGGTLLARKIPNAIIISTRKKFSLEAIKEAELINQNEIVDIGKINIELKDFNNLIDMFDISSRIRTENIKPEEIIVNYNDGYDLFGQF